MKAHQLDANGVIFNTIVVDDLDVFPNLVDASIGGSVGDSIVDGEVVPKQPTIDLDVLRVAAIAKTYCDVNGVYDDAVGSRTEEYKDAEVDARAFKAVGYEGEPTANVSGFAAKNPTCVPQTNQWAADQIIARADAFALAKVSMRNTRFERQADMRAATTVAELDTATAAWDAYIAGIRTQLELQSLPRSISPHSF